MLIILHTFALIILLCYNAGLVWAVVSSLVDPRKLPSGRRPSTDSQVARVVGLAYTHVLLFKAPPSSSLLAERILPSSTLQTKCSMIWLHLFSVHWWRLHHLPSLVQFQVPPAALLRQSSLGCSMSMSSGALSSWLLISVGYIKHPCCLQRLGILHYSSPLGKAPCLGDSG